MKARLLADKMGQPSREPGFTCQSRSAPAEQLTPEDSRAADALSLLPLLEAIARTIVVSARTRAFGLVKRHGVRAITVGSASA